MEKKDLLSLKLQATQVRLNIMRMVRAAHHGHIGGALSATDVVTALYFYKMRVDPKNPAWEDRDRFILSAGHKSLVQYSALACKGFFEPEIMDTYGSLGSHIPGHPDMHKLPGVEANTGALGHGMSIATGMALSAKMDKKDYRVYVVMGDGELPEGSNWEAAAAAAHYHLDNLTVFVDYNGLQISGKVEEVMDMTPIADHFRAFGWNAVDIDGNDMEQIVNTLDQLPLETGKPTAVVCHTVKAKGLLMGEGKASYHFWNPKEEELDVAEADLKALAESLKAEMEEA